MKRALIFLTLSFAALAQQAGVAPEWEARRDIPALPDKIKKLLPVLQQLHPEQWVAKGASDAYVQQWKSVQAEAGYLQTTVDSLAKQPDKLTLALEAYFRMLAIETRMGNLVEAIRKYQNPALADLLQSMAADNLTARVGLQQYITDVATQRESEWKIMESEAQRCRTQMTAPGTRPSQRKP